MLMWLQWGLYFQTGGKEMKDLLASVGEPMLPAVERYLEIYGVKAITVPEQFAVCL